MIAVFGHTNPDTDAIASALLYAELLRLQGHAAQAYRLGEPNNETRFVLKTAGAELPLLLETLAPGSAAALVDHNESSQSLPGLGELRVTHVIDHHRLGDLQTADVPYLRFEPLGSTGSILYRLWREAGLVPTAQQALLMQACILSDTMEFRRPTTTEHDRRFAAELAGLSGHDSAALAAGMFAAKSDVGGLDAGTLLKTDYKVFCFGEDDWGLGVVETTHPQAVLERKDELLQAMDLERAQAHLRGVLLCVVDILNERNTALVPGATEAEALQQIFGAQTSDHLADLGGRISRKKQLVPAFEAHFG